VLRLTVAPASIVKVTPELTSVGPSRLYGLFALVHMAFELIMPPTSVEAYTVPKCTATANVESKSAIMKYALSIFTPSTNNTSVFHL